MKSDSFSIWRLPRESHTARYVTVPSTTYYAWEVEFGKVFGKFYKKFRIAE